MLRRCSKYRSLVFVAFCRNSSSFCRENSRNMNERLCGVFSSVSCCAFGTFLPRYFLGCLKVDFAYSCFLFDCYRHCLRKKRCARKSESSPRKLAAGEAAFLCCSSTSCRSSLCRSLFFPRSLFLRNAKKCDFSASNSSFLFGGFLLSGTEGLLQGLPDLFSLRSSRHFSNSSRKENSFTFRKSALKVKELLRPTCSSAARLGLRFAKNPFLTMKDCYEYSKHACLHTWLWTKTGFTLFFANLRVSYQLLRKKLLGHPLRLSEHKLLVRTIVDSLKLIPFSLFIIIPFAEFALPICLKFFPNMLPSTFFEKKYDNAYLQRILKAKQELAEFFQELIQERTKQIIDTETDKTILAKASALCEFQQKLKKTDCIEVSPFLSLDDTLQFAKLFKKEFVMENMNLKTLQVMCELLGIKPYSVKSYVLLQLRYHLLYLQREDRDILWEGVNSLTHEELIESCKGRAMRFYGLSDDEMRQQMVDWLQMSSHQDIPPLLLIWSRCITITHTDITVKDSQEEHESKITHDERVTEIINDLKDEIAEQQLLKEVNERVNELRSQEEDLKKSIKRLQNEEKLKKALNSEAVLAKTKCVTEDKIESDEVLTDSYIIEDYKPKITQKECIKKSEDMENELKHLRYVSSLQYNLLSKAVSIIIENSHLNFANPESVELLVSGLSEVEKLLENIKYQKFENQQENNICASESSFNMIEKNLTAESFDCNSKSSSCKSKTNLTFFSSQNEFDQVKTNKSNFSSFASSFAPSFISNKQVFFVKSE